LVLCAELDERGLVQPDRGRLVQPFAVAGEQGLAVGGHGVVDRAPIAVESSATSEVVLPVPTCVVAHLAALVVGKQFLAAMR
jgi:hypothetical protein